MEWKSVRNYAFFIVNYVLFIGMDFDRIMEAFDTLAIFQKAKNSQLSAS